MNVDSIKALLADPKIDPSAWLGQALINWILTNPESVLQDVHARKYILQGMDLKDARRMSSHIMAYYNESDDAQLVEHFFDALNTLLTGEASYNYNWLVEDIFEQFYKKIDPLITSLMVNLHVAPSRLSEPPESFWDHLQSDQVKTLIRNYIPINWGTKRWHYMINLLPKKDLCEYATSELLPKLIVEIDDNRITHIYPIKVQSILYSILERIPQNHARKFYQFLKWTDFSPCWVYYSHLISKKRQHSPIYMDELVCRCGIVTASKSGATLHAKACGAGLNLMQTSRWLMAQSDNSMCDKCGREFGSSSSLTLHRKRCKETLFNSFKEKRYEIHGV